MISYHVSGQTRAAGGGKLGARGHGQVALWHKTARCMCACTRCIHALHAYARAPPASLYVPPRRARPGKVPVGVHTCLPHGSGDCLFRRETLAIPRGGGGRVQPTPRACHPCRFISAENEMGFHAFPVQFQFPMFLAGLQSLLIRPSLAPSAGCVAWMVILPLLSSVSSPTSSGFIWSTYLWGYACCPCKCQ